MEWHKISDGDYPETERGLIVAFAHIDGAYSDLNCECASMEIFGRGTRKWIMAVDVKDIEPSDRWTYINPPVN